MAHHNAPQLLQEVSPYELAMLVLDYLERNGLSKTAASLKREAKDLIKSSSSSRPVEMKPLKDIVEEYLRLLTRENLRRNLQHLNPLAAQMYGVLEHGAGIPQYQAQQQQLKQLQQQQQEQTAAAALAGTDPTSHMQQGQQSFYGGPVPVAAIGGPPNGAALETGTQFEARPQAHVTPSRHAQRKGAPKKRRRLDQDFEGARPGANLMPHSPPDFNLNENSLFGDAPFDLLNMPVNPMAMMHMIDHPGEEIVNKLAENINKQLHTANHTEHFLEDNDFSLTELFKDSATESLLRKLVEAPEHPEQHYGGTARPSATMAAAGEYPRGAISLEPEPLGGDRPLPPRQGVGTNSVSPNGRRGAGQGRKTGGLNGGGGSGAGGNGAETGVDKRTVPDKILQNPEELEDLINKVVGR